MLIIMRSGRAADELLNPVRDGEELPLRELAARTTHLVGSFLECVVTYSLPAGSLLGIPNAPCLFFQHLNQDIVVASCAFA
jgi:hypothetical protein